jgi:hypothetical protein
MVRAINRIIGSEIEQRILSTFEYGSPASSICSWRLLYFLYRSILDINLICLFCFAFHTQKSDPVNSHSIKRKLSAILSADLKEYSRLMSQDELGTIRTLTAYKGAMSTIIRQYKCRVVDSPGDNLLAEFVSVVDAVNSAVEIQRQLAERNTELPYGRRMEFRIGINLGNVVEEGDRIYGDGVNLAARMESLAEGGGICISGTESVLRPSLSILPRGVTCGRRITTET